MKDGDFAGADIVGLTADEIARLCRPSRLVETEKGCTEIFDITYGI